MSTPTAIILDCEGTRLTPGEKRFFADSNPYGFIVFTRNCVDHAQLRALTSDIKEAVGRADVPIFIDQEGGRVTRLKPPAFRPCPSAGSLAALGRDAASAIYLNARLIAHELHGLGINADCAPVVDLLIPGAHAIVGDRAYGSTPRDVAALAGEMARGLMDGGVTPVIKHIPGHGRATVDSHHSLPVVDAPLAQLQQTDFAAFRALAALPMAMTAHIIYNAIDAARPATASPEVIRLIREDIGFDGLLMSDELTMKALTGSLESRVRGALSAGCDVVMFCNGIVTLSLEEKKAALEVAGAMSAEAVRRAEQAHATVQARAHAAQALDVPRAEAQLSALMRHVA